MALSDGALTLFAPAKVNLFLHVLSRRPDGYHELESLIVFAGIGDRLTVSPGPDLSLRIDGPFAPALADEPVADNLIMRAARALADAAGIDPTGRVTLEKCLPVASGIGGGSADAAAALRLLAAHWGINVDSQRMHEIGVALGADIPVCQASRPAYVTGIGEHVAPTPRLPGLWMVLVNSGTPVPTGPVFKGLDPAAMPGVCGPDVPHGAYGEADAFLAALRVTRNDLEGSARRVAPDIAQVLDALTAQPGCRLARMSGSGGTCFGLFTEQALADAAVEAIRTGQPSWWAACGPVLQDAPLIEPGGPGLGA